MNVEDTSFPARFPQGTSESYFWEENGLEYAAFLNTKTYWRDTEVLWGNQRSQSHQPGSWLSYAFYRREKLQRSFLLFPSGLVFLSAKKTARIPEPKCSDRQFRLQRFVNVLPSWVLVKTRETENSLFRNKSSGCLIDPIHMNFTTNMRQGRFPCPYVRLCRPNTTGSFDLWMETPALFARWNSHSHERQHWRVGQHGSSRWFSLAAQWDSRCMGLHHVMKPFNRSAGLCGQLQAGSRFSFHRPTSLQKVFAS